MFKGILIELNCTLSW